MVSIRHVVADDDVARFVRKALRNIRSQLQILDDHVKHCVAGALASGDAAEAQAKA